MEAHQTVLHGGVLRVLQEIREQVVELVNFNGESDETLALHVRPELRDDALLGLDRVHERRLVQRDAPVLHELLRLRLSHVEVSVDDVVVVLEVRFTYAKSVEDVSALMPHNSSIWLYSRRRVGRRT